MTELSLFSSISAMMFSLGCYSIITVIIIGLIIFACLENYGSSKNDAFDGLVLGERQRNRDGYTGTKSKRELLGAIAVCSTDLRPAGSVTVEGEPVDVVTEGDFIKKGDIVKIINVEGSRVLVRRI